MPSVAGKGARPEWQLCLFKRVLLKGCRFQLTFNAPQQNVYHSNARQARSFSSIKIGQIGSHMTYFQLLSFPVSSTLSIIHHLVESLYPELVKLKDLVQEPNYSNYSNLAKVRFEPATFILLTQNLNRKIRLTWWVYMRI